MLRLFLRLLPTINARQLAWFRADLQGGMLRISPPGRELKQSALRSQTDCTQFKRSSGTTSIRGRGACCRELTQLPQLGQNRTDFRVLFRRNSLFVGPTSAQTPM